MNDDLAKSLKTRNIELFRQVLLKINTYEEINAQDTFGRTFLHVISDQGLVFFLAHLLETSKEIRPRFPPPSLSNI